MRRACAVYEPTGWARRGREALKRRWLDHASGFGASAHSNTSSTKTPTPTPMMVAMLERGERGTCVLSARAGDAQRSVRLQRLEISETTVKNLPVLRAKCPPTATSTRGRTAAVRHSCFAPVCRRHPPPPPPLFRRAPQQAHTPPSLSHTTPAKHGGRRNVQRDVRRAAVRRALPPRAREQRHLRLRPRHRRGTFPARGLGASAHGAGDECPSSIEGLSKTAVMHTRVEPSVWCQR